jgi:hypothetical protein
MYSFTIESIKKTKCWINGIQSHLELPAPESLQRIAYFISFKGRVASLNEEVDKIYLSWLDNRIVSAQMMPRVTEPKRKSELDFTTGYQPIWLLNGLTINNTQPPLAKTILTK